jgi:hypothetical protein
VIVPDGIFVTRTHTMTPDARRLGRSP